MLRWAVQRCVRADIVVIAFVAVLAVSGVPGFAQTNTTDRQRSHSAANVARTYEAARATGDEGVALAPNITVTSLYRSLVAQMLERSATFRRQCARIGRAPLLTIEIRTDATRRREYARARTTFVRRANDQLHAVVTVTAGDRPAELIAHELEHVLEQLDGVNLHHLSRVRSSGVKECNCDDTASFETTRAIKAGLQVAAEVGDLDS
jgi:hypothetical protein